MKLKLIVIDSLTGIQGRRFQNADTIMTQQIGDQALTLKDGLLMILPTIRKHKIALIMTAHVRAELDQLEQMRGKKVKMAAAWATKHTAEFFGYVEKNQSKDGRVSLDGQEFVDKSVVDFMDKGEKTGHKIRFRIDESSIGPQGRTAEFTLDYNKGIINTFEEAFTLGKNYGIIERPNNQMWSYNGQSYRGVPAILGFLKDTPEACQKILEEVRKKDIESRKD
jgi:RecA/RadA recombinase